MKMDIRQPDCLLLAIYERDGKLSTMGKLRRTNGTLNADIELEHHGTDPFAVLVEALEDAVQLRTKHCQVFTNSEALGEFFTPPIKVPQPDRQEVRVGRHKTVEIPAGGDPNQWRALHLLLGYRKWKVRQVRGNQIKETRETWRRQWKPEPVTS